MQKRKVHTAMQLRSSVEQLLADLVHSTASLASSDVAGGWDCQHFLRQGGAANIILTVSVSSEAAAIQTLHCMFAVNLWAPAITVIPQFCVLAMC